MHFSTFSSPAVRCRVFQSRVFSPQVETVDLMQNSDYCYNVFYFSVCSSFAKTPPNTDGGNFACCHKKAAAKHIL